MGGAEEVLGGQWGGVGLLLGGPNGIWGGQMELGGAVGG